MAYRAGSCARRAPLAIAIGTALACAGCIDTDAAVFVDASISNPSAVVAQQTLATTVAGSFALRLHLGPRASGPAEVTLGVVSMTNADQTATLVDLLAVQTSLPFPVSVPVDSDVDVGITFAEEDNLLDTATYDALCAAGTVVVSGALDDSLRGGTTTVASAPFGLAGCP